MATTNSSKPSAAPDTASPPASRLPFTLWALAGLLLLGAFIGWLVGQVWLALAVVLGALLAWHLYYLTRLERWLRHGAPLRAPVGAGLWSGVFDRLYRLRRAERQRKRRLAALLRQFSQAAAALPDGAVVLNAQDQVLWCNAAAGRLLGLKSSQDVGNPIGNVLRHPDFSAWLNQGEPGNTLTLTSPQSGQIQLNLRLISYSATERLLLVRDVTHLRRLEQVRQDFVANASHELRSPLTVISGYLESMEGELEADWQNVIREMRAQSKRMRSIVEDLLTLSRLDSASQPAGRNIVDVSDLLDAIQHEAGQLSGGKHELQFQIDDGLKLRGEAQDLRSAFANLVSNAVRYTQEGGRIMVRWYYRDGNACFQVEDNGPGIAAQHLPRLTERFYRVSPSRSRGSGGTGLGLSIVKHVLENHQAELRIESKLGLGSTFTCVFPARRIMRGAA